MRKRPANNDKINHSRWLVSYADFMTLLFAFFVVLYSISVVHEDKFNKVKKSLSTSLSSTVVLPEEVQKFLAKSVTSVLPEGFTPSVKHPKPDQIGMEDIDLSHFDYEIHDILEQGLTLKSLQDDVIISDESPFVQIETSVHYLFSKNTSELTKNGEILLTALAKEFSKFPHAINIEVFAAGQDGRDINQWRIPANQGANVLRWLQLEGVDGRRLSSTSYGPLDFRKGQTQLSYGANQFTNEFKPSVYFLIDQDSVQDQRINIFKK